MTEAKEYSAQALDHEIRKYKATLAEIKDLCEEISWRLSPNMSIGDVLEIKEMEDRLKKYSDAISWHSNSINWAYGSRPS